MVSEEYISAFAFKVGKLIESTINERTVNLNETNVQLNANILNFRNKLSQGFVGTTKDLLDFYDKHFNITEFKNGKI